MSDESAERANKLVAAYILKQFHAEFDQGWPHASTEKERHLAACLTMRLEDSSGFDGFYGCETGCEYVTLEAAFACDCGVQVDYEYGQFGDLADLLDDLMKGYL